MKLPQIIAIAGTNGSGKDSLGELLQREKNYQNISLSNILRDILDTKGLPHTRENLSGQSKEIRDREGDGGMMVRGLELYDSDKYQGIAITSIRTPGEVDALHEGGGLLVWIDADPRVRYERLQRANRGRGATDQLSFEDFLQQQEAEMNPSATGNGLNMAAVKEKADIFMTNEFETLEDFYSYAREFFEL